MEIKCPQSVDFFLGTTTPAGFKGYFRQLGQEPGMQLYLIKSGPGCGKSTMMKQLAQLSAGPVQRIHCASSRDAGASSVDSASITLVWLASGWFWLSLSLICTCAGRKRKPTMPPSMRCWRGSIGSRSQLPPTPAS